jgi:hypothetical protein
MSATDPPAFADSLAEEQYTREGYIVMPMLDASEIDYLTRLYLDTVPSLPADFYSTAFLPDCPERRIMTEGMQAVLEPHFTRLFPGYTIHSRGYIAKRGGPDQKPLRLHQDYTYVDQSIHRAVHIWIPLIDVTEDNGCLTLVPRSHHLVNHISAMIDNPSPYDPFRTVLDKECKISLPMKAGEAFVYDQRLLHGSTSNKREGIRIAMGIALLPAGVEQLMYVVDDEFPSKLNVLEVRDEFAVRMGRGVKLLPPYPEGVRKVGEIDYTAEALSAEKLDSLRIQRAKPEIAPEPAAKKTPELVPLPAEKHGLLSRLFGRN